MTTGLTALTTSLCLIWMEIIMDKIKYGAKLCDTHGCLTNIAVSQKLCSSCRIKELEAEVIHCKEELAEHKLARAIAEAKCEAMQDVVDAAKEYHESMGNYPKLDKAFRNFKEDT